MMLIVDRAGDGPARGSLPAGADVGAEAGISVPAAHRVEPVPAIEQDRQVRVGHAARDILRMLRPHRLEGTGRIRVGRAGNGGYVMIDRLTGTGAAYSIGIGDDVSWDMDIAARGIHVYQYDPAIAALPDAHPLFHWAPKFVTGHIDDEAGHATIEHLIARNGHGDRQDLILKCDIGGHEWLVLRATSNAVLRQFRQIVIRLNRMEYLVHPISAENLRRSIANLTASHRVVHVHGCNRAAWVVTGGIPLPSVLEVTLVRDDEGVFTPSDEIFPTAIDIPSDPEQADLYLGSFSFD